MALRWRGVVPFGILLATGVGCSGGGGEPSGSITGGGSGTTASGGTGLAATGGMGTGGASMFGGAAGTAAGGGRGGIGGNGMNTGGTSMSGGASGIVPTAWTCAGTAYGDGRCDCGCGAPDKDCAQQDLAHCQVCNGSGSCSLLVCPGRVDPVDVTTCPAPPQGWTCSPSTYDDGTQCDCGCGVPDPDCADNSVASCDNCLAAGSCAKGLCPSSIVADDNARCQVPVKWSCDPSTYGDGVCNCGCGVVDVDCADATAASCQECAQSSCSPFTCMVNADDNARCPVPPYTWLCSPRLYGDGSRCDCGCGAIDPDCATLGRDACDRCNDPGSCSAVDCPGLIDATFNSRCDTPPTPAGWTCGPGLYGDGTCDCGCAVPDIDCRTSDFSSCIRCEECGGNGICGTTIDTADPTQCAPPPAGWSCSAAAFRDQYCDCGCGVPDPMCQGIEALYVCGNFPVEGCSAGKKSHVDPNHNALCIVNVPAGWTCDRTFYDDGLCDCGCGAVDLDCATNDVGTCDLCNDTGSCSTARCPGTIAAGDLAHCAN